MAFTVGRNDGFTKDAEFEAYARLLRQQGVDLGKLPRAPSQGLGAAGCTSGIPGKKLRPSPTS